MQFWNIQLQNLSTFKNVTNDFRFYRNSNRCGQEFGEKLEEFTEVWLSHLMKTIYRKVKFMVSKILRFLSTCNTGRGFSTIFTKNFFNLFCSFEKMWPINSESIKIQIEVTNWCEEFAEVWYSRFMYNNSELKFMGSKILRFFSTWQ